MPKAIILKGLPGSGKSTRAKQIREQDPTFLYLNNDTIRDELSLGKYSLGIWNHKLEKKVGEEFKKSLSNIVAYKFNVILDNTYLNPKSFNKDYDYLKSYGYDIEIIDLTCVPLETCIQRDLKRKKKGERSVGTEVIMMMWSKYIKPTIIPPRFDLNKKPAIICDLDGTLAILNGRNPYDASRCHETDSINLAVASLIKAMVNNGYNICFTSGRPEKFWYQTEKFLALANFSPCIGSSFHLYMRRDDSQIDDTAEKTYLYYRYIEPYYNVEFAIDDRPKVVRLWKTLGIPVFNVGDGYEF